MSTCSATVALRTISEHYPELFTGGSFIYGLPTDTPERVRDLFTAAHALPIDHLFFIPLTPLPGTPYWRDNMWDATGERFRHFNFLPDPNDARLSELSAALCRAAFLSWPRNRVRQLFRGLLSRDARKRRINRHLLLRGFQFLLPRVMSASARRRRDAMYTPAWYEE
jgi:hypothetical protein